MVIPFEKATATQQDPPFSPPPLELNVLPMEWHLSKKIHTQTVRVLCKLGRHEVLRYCIYYQVGDELTGSSDCDGAGL